MNEIHSYAQGNESGALEIFMKRNEKIRWLRCSWKMQEAMYCVIIICSNVSVADAIVSSNTWSISNLSAMAESPATHVL